MRKWLLFCTAVLFLSSCILVDDLGNYWDKGVIDPALVGIWKPEDASKPSSDKFFKITLRGDALQADSLNKQERAQKDYKPIQFKTLRVPPYTFFMVRDGPSGKGVLVRYKQTGKSLQLYVPHYNEANAYLRAGYPEDMRELSVPLAIRTLTAQALKMLSLIPDEPTYWKASGRWEKQTKD